MTARPPGISHNQNAANYVNKKGINELFEAIMTALMIQKPEDHLGFIRECLDKAQRNPNRIRWELFVTNSNAGRAPAASRSLSNRTRTKPLPPVRPLNSPTKSNSSTSIKPSALPPIDDRKKNFSNLPIVFILSSTGSTKLCSRLIERYEKISYLSIHDIANIDEDHPLDLKKLEHRYESVSRVVEEFHLKANGVLIAGDVAEENFLKKWHDKLGRIDLMMILSSNRKTQSVLDYPFIQIDPNADFNEIFANAVRVLDGIFTKNNSAGETFAEIKKTNVKFPLPVFFCIDNHRSVPKETTQKSLPHENAQVDDEFDLLDDENEEQSNNSFINSLCERIASQFSFQHIHYGDFNKKLLDFDQIKSCIIESMSTRSGFIIDHFPNSFSDLNKFYDEIGSCSALIYIGEDRSGTENDELNAIVEQFKREKKAVFVDCRMEVDEIYEDLKNELLLHI